MRLNMEKRRTWTPEYAENMKLPVAERIEIDFDKPAAYQRSAWETTYAERTKDGKIATYVKRDVKAILTNSNVAIRNLYYMAKDDKGKEKKIYIDTGLALAQAQNDFCYLLAEDLAREILRADIEGALAKNSEPASGSSSEA